MAKRKAQRNKKGAPVVGALYFMNIFGYNADTICGPFV